MEETVKELLEEERRLKNSSWFTDTAIGISDGLAVPFALAAGLSRVVDSSNIILLAGTVAVAAGAVSMGIGGYFAVREELETEHEELKNEVGHTANLRTEKEEVKTFFANLDLPEEMQQQATEEVLKDKEKWADCMLKHEPVVDKRSPLRAIRSGWNIGLAYVVGGIVPLSPFVFINTPIEALKISALITLVFLFVFGWLKNKLTGLNPWEGALRTTLIGALAAGAAFMVARLFEA